MADAKGIRAGSAFVELFADDAALQKGLKAAESSVKGFGVSVGKIGASLAGLGGLITAPLIAAVNMFAEGGSELAHMAERTGMSVEALSVLGYAAKQSGTDLESVEVAVKRLQKAMTAGSLENAQAAQTFAELGINVRQLMKLKPDQQFEIVAKRLASVQNPAARAGASMMLFGRSGTALLPLIEHLGALSKEAKDFGLVTSTEAAEGALKLEHSMKLLDAISKKIFTTIGSALAPMFEEWNAKLAKVEKGVLDLVKANKPLVVTIAQVGFALVAAGTAITTLGVVIFGFGQVIGAVSAVIGLIYSALLLLTTPLGLVVVGFVAMTTAMGAWGEAGQRVGGFMQTNFSDMLKTALATFKGISDALKAGDIELAARVLWAGLQVEWIQGTTKLIDAWEELKSKTSGIFATIKFNIASHMTDAWAAIKSGAVAAAFGISDAFESVWHNIIIGFRRAMEAVGQGTHEATQAAVAARDKQATESGAGQKEIQDQIEKDRQDAQAAIDSAENVEAEDRHKQDNDRVNAAKKELADAKARLAGLGKKAAEEAGAPEASGEGGQGPGKAMTPEGLDKGLGEGAKKAAVDVMGTFSAVGAAGAGVGQSIEKEHLEESKKQTKELEKIKKNTDARQVFAT